MRRTRMPAHISARVNALRAARAERARPPGAPAPRVEVRALADDESELLIYEAISDWWGISATDVVKALSTVETPKLTVRVNSPGGDVFDGVAIYNAIADHPADTTVMVDGLAASAASLIAMAGDRVVMNSGTQMMIHDAWGICIGNAADMADCAELLDLISATLAGVYAERAGGTIEEWRERMKAETWYDAAGAVDIGLADEHVTRGRRAGSDDGETDGSAQDRVTAPDNHAPSTQDIDRRMRGLAARYGLPLAAAPFGEMGKVADIVEANDQYVVPDATFMTASQRHSWLRGGKT